MTEQHISKLDMKRLRRNSLRRIEKELGNGTGEIRKPKNYITTAIDSKFQKETKPIISESQKEKETLISKNKKREPWPLCVICAESTSANPGKTPQWWDNQWQCETCTFGWKKLPRVKGKYE